jgi:hypothetical protein
MNKGKSLQDKLAQSLDQANTREARTSRPAPAPEPPGTGKCAKISVSLFRSDLDRLQAIQDFMAARGSRISTSQAVKLALRTAPLSDTLQAALDQVRREDGRKW